MKGESPHGSVEAHLVLNHVPVVGLIFGLVFFVAGLKSASRAAQLAGLRIFVAMGVVVVLVAGSGLVGANLLEAAPWLDPEAVSVHRQVGVLTLVVLLSLGGVSGALLLVSWTNSVLPAWAMRTVVVLAIAGIGATVWAAYLSGALRHTELGRRSCIDVSTEAAASSGSNWQPGGVSFSLAQSFSLRSEQSTATNDSDARR